MNNKIKKIETYLKKHVVYNSIIHIIGGVGIGIVITYPLIRNHPVRWSVVFLAIAILGHLYPLFVKK